MKIKTNLIIIDKCCNLVCYIIAKSKKVDFRFGVSYNGIFFA